MFEKRVTAVQVSSTYGEALRELQTLQPRELQKLASVFSDQFMTVLPELESKIGIILQDSSIEQRIKLDYQAFLFNVVLRCSTLDDTERRARLRSMIRPVTDSWLSSELNGFLNDFDSFRNWLGLDQACGIFIEHNASRLDDWSMLPLDGRAIDLKNSVSNRIEVCSPRPLCLSLTLSGRTFTCNEVITVRIDRSCSSWSRSIRIYALSMARSHARYFATNTAVYQVGNPN